ncbi:LPXTG cell wall anchor domain-containing protein [Pandoraea apista]|uniref:LPXTG cell wall anchor domain-containing protein n=1 Tax=Pandoraea apista TaxID=93218 RepID=UPI0009E4FCB7
MKYSAVAMLLGGVSTLVRAGDRLASAMEGESNWWFAVLGVICLLFAGGLWAFLKKRVACNNH